MVLYSPISASLLVEDYTSNHLETCMGFIVFWLTPVVNVSNSIFLSSFQLFYFSSIFQVEVSSTCTWSTDDFLTLEFSLLMIRFLFSIPDLFSI